MKFHTIPPEKDKETNVIYSSISIIEMGYISEHFQLNIEATKNFESFRFNELWISYRRTSRALAVKCQGNCLCGSRLKCLLRKANYILTTKEGMQEGNYDDELLEFLFRLELENF